MPGRRYLESIKPSVGKTDMDVLRENHQFVRDKNADDDATWEVSEGRGQGRGREIEGGGDRGREKGRKIEGGREGGRGPWEKRGGNRRTKTNTIMEWRAAQQRRQLCTHILLTQPRHPPS